MKNKNIAGQFKGISKLASILVFSVGILVLTGWIFDIPFLKSILPIWASMKVNTALAFMLAGMSLFMQQEAAALQKQWLGKLLAVVILGIGILTLAEYFWGLNLGIDDFLFTDPEGPYPGRMAPTTAFCFVLTGFALVFLQSKHASFQQILALILFCISWIAITGYLYGAESLYHVKPYVSVAFHTAVCFMILSIGIFLNRPSSGFTKQLNADDLGGIMLRRLLPSIPFLIITLGWLRVLGQKAGYYDTPFGVALLTLLSTAVIIVLVWRNAISISKLDATRLEAERSLVSLNQELEKRVEERGKELSKLNEEFRVVVETAQDAIISADQHGIICYWNRQAEKFFGYSGKEIVGQSLTRIMPERFRKAHSRGIERVVTTSTSKLIGRTVELNGLKKNGQEFPIDLSLGSWKIENKIFFTAIIRDASERKHLQAELVQSQKMEAVGKLAGGIAHDFNNLLTVINGYAEMRAQSLNPEDPICKDFEEILKAGMRAQSLTTQLLGFSRRQMIRPAIVNLNEVITGLDKMLKRLLGETIVILTELAPDLGTVKVDEHQIEQVLVNLAVNARDAMPQGGKITLKTENVILEGAFIQQFPDVAEGEYTLTSITDTGTGMKEEVKKHIFEPFYTTKEKGKGSGLGLATSYGIVKQNKGHITFVSEINQGTTFKLYLPIVRERVEKEDRETSPIVQKGNETVLIVEDDALVRGLAVRILKAQGYRTFEAANGALALQFMESHPETLIHLLLTDVIMPVMGGKELSEQVKKLRPEIKIIFMSGYTDNMIDQQGILDVNINFVQKPFVPMDLAGKVRAVLDK